MSDCSAFESKLKGLTPNSKPEDAQPLVEALKEVNQARLLGSDLQKQAEAGPPGGGKGGLVMPQFVLDGGEALATIVKREGKVSAIDVKHKSGDSETLKYDGSIIPQPMEDTVRIACSPKPIISTFTIGRDGKVARDEIDLPNGTAINLDATGKITDIKKADGVLFIDEDDDHDHDQDHDHDHDHDHE